MSDQGASPRHDHSQIEKLTDQVQALATKVTEYVTVTRRHIVQQEAINKQMSSMLGAQDERLRALENWRAARDATLPKRLLDGDRVEAEIESVRGQVESIKHVLAKWAGIAVCAMTVVQLFARPMVEWAFGLLAGGGH